MCFLYPFHFEAFILVVLFCLPFITVSLGAKELIRYQFTPLLIFLSFAQPSWQIICQLMEQMYDSMSLIHITLQVSYIVPC
jgi:hypothetical protein